MHRILRKLQRTLIPESIIIGLQQKQQQKDFDAWERNGKPLPPPHLVKQQAIAFYQKKYQCATLVETGTYMGDMVAAQRNNFERIISIELSEQLYGEAKERFRKHPHIQIMQGDSGKVLHKIIPTLQGPALFWLDGHYSAGITAKGEKECPIFEELDAIFQPALLLPHVLLIDDARCFNGQSDYPTIPQLTTYVQQKDNRYVVEVKDDVIRCTIG